MKEVRIIHVTSCDALDCHQVPHIHTEHACKLEVPMMVCFVIGCWRERVCYTIEIRTPLPTPHWAPWTNFQALSSRLQALIWSDPNL